MTATNFDSNEKSLQLKLHHQFEKQKIDSLIEQCGNVEQLRSIAKQFVQAFFVQKVATDWAIQQAMDNDYANHLSRLKEITSTVCEHCHPL